MREVPELWDDCQGALNYREWNQSKRGNCVGRAGGTESFDIGTELQDLEFSCFGLVSIQCFLAMFPFLLLEMVMRGGLCYCVCGWNVIVVPIGVIAERLP